MQAPRSRPLIDNTFWLMLAVLAALSVLAYTRGGQPLVLEGWRSGAAMLVRFSLVVVLAFLVAGLAEKLVPQEWVRARLGAESGLRGLVLATAVGALTPSGPFVSMPLAVALLRAGAGMGAVVAFLSAWALLAIHRLVAWEIPFLGWKVALLRFGLSLWVPVLLGWGARLLWRS